MTDNSNIGVKLKARSRVRDRSALIISHRFSTVRLADRIYVLKDGPMTEQVNHDKLMALDGYYARLYRKQAILPG
jgi:ATP-binding cassette subfamily B protein